MGCLGDEFGCRGSCREFWSGDRFVGAFLNCAILGKDGMLLIFGKVYQYTSICFRRWSCYSSFLVVILFGKIRFHIKFAPPHYY